LHQQTRHRTLTDLGASDAQLSQKLITWWQLDFSGFRREIKAAFRHDIPLDQRADWETWLGLQRVEHERLTAEIAHLETALNDRVYELFGLTQSEIKVIAKATKYHYGEV
jgi:hypothetical protein